MAVETKKRVKVYNFGVKLLQWEDMGTGRVSMDFVERNQVPTIIVRSEVDGRSPKVSTQQITAHAMHASLFFFVQDQHNSPTNYAECLIISVIVFFTAYIYIYISSSNFVVY